MPRPMPADYLQDDEEVLHQTGRHPLSALDGILIATVAAGLAVAGILVGILGYAPGLWRPLGLPAVIAVAVLYGVFCLARYWRVQTSLYTVTSDRTYQAYGRFRFFLGQTTYDKVTDLHVHQSLFGRLFGFGTVRVETAGTGIALDGVHDPFAYKQQIERARTAFLHRLLGERPAVAPRERDEAESEAADGPAEPLWTDRPCLPSFIGQAVGTMSMLIPAVFLLVAGAATEPVMLGIGGFLLLMAVATGLNAWIRYRRTRYHVEERGVVVTSGWLTRRRVETTFEKVTDVTVYQSLAARIFDYGNITINTAGSNTAPVVFQGLRSPETAKRTIDEARRRWEERH